MITLAGFFSFLLFLSVALAATNHQGAFQTVIQISFLLLITGILIYIHDLRR